MMRTFSPSLCHAMTGQDNAHRFFPVDGALMGVAFVQVGKNVDSLQSVVNSPKSEASSLPAMSSAAICGAAPSFICGGGEGGSFCALIRRFDGRDCRVGGRKAGDWRCELSP